MHNRLSRRALVALTAACAAMAVFAVQVNANGVVSGEVELAPDQATFEGFADMGIAVEPTGPASIGGSGFIFPANGGDIDPAANYQGIIGGLGGVKFTRAGDGAKVKFKALSVVIGPRKASIGAAVRNTFVKFAKVTEYDISGNDKSFQLKNGATTLSRGAAKLMKRKFDFPFRRGIPLGTLDIKAKLTKDQVQE